MIDDIACDEHAGRAFAINAFDGMFTLLDISQEILLWTSFPLQLSSTLS